MLWVAIFLSHVCHTVTWLVAWHWWTLQWHIYKKNINDVFMVPPTEPCHGTHALMPAFLWSGVIVVMTVVLVIIRQSGRWGCGVSDRKQALCGRTRQMYCLVTTTNLDNKSGLSTRALRDVRLYCQASFNVLSVLLSNTRDTLKKKKKRNSSSPGSKQIKKRRIKNWTRWLFLPNLHKHVQIWYLPLTKWCK